MSSSGAASAVVSTTIYASIVSPDSTSTDASTDDNQLPTVIIAASGTAPTATFSYLIPGASSSATTTSISSTSSTSRVSTAAKVAVGVAVPLLILALLCGLLFFFRRRREKILSETKEPEYELGFSPTPTHTTFFEKDGIDSRVDSRADTLNNSLTGSRIDNRSLSQPGSTYDQSRSQMGSYHDSRSNSRMDSRNESRSGSRVESRPGSRLDSRMNSRNSMYKPTIGPYPGQNPAYIAELGSPSDVAPGENYRHAYPIHEIGPGKEPEDEGESDTEDTIVYEIVELPDTSRKSVKNWNRRTAGSVAEPIPVTRIVGRANPPVPPIPENEDPDRSWLAEASGPTTPTKARFI